MSIIHDIPNILVHVGAKVCQDKVYTLETKRKQLVKVNSRLRSSANVDEYE